MYQSRRAISRLAVLILLVVASSSESNSQVRVPFTRTEAMIAMRDGVRLHTVILTPQTQTEQLPILIDRTPYGVNEWNSDLVNNAYKEFVADGYIFVFQDIRGKFDSEGQFVMVRPPRDKRDPKSIDESTDTYDTIDWLVKNVARNNGRVGIMGGSYDGWLATMALIGPHPALKAASPQAPVGDFWMGDDFFHNGAFRMSYGYEYVKLVETSKTLELVSFGDQDAYDLYLSLNPLTKLTAQLGGKLPTWNDFVAHPHYDSFWQQRAVRNYLNPATVPTLLVGGWWDQEDLYGPLVTYQTLQQRDKKNLVFLVEGPWNHGGWRSKGRSLAQVDFGSDTGTYFREHIEAPWFAYYLKDKGKLKQAEATIFQSGTNKWMTYDAWPPRRNVRKADLFLQAGGRLSFEKSSAAKPTEEFDGYTSDPASPVLEENVTVTGDIVAHLFASTSGTDSDWVVKLIDVYPSDDAKTAGYQLMVASEIFRGRYLNSFERAEALAAGRVNEYKIDLHGNDYAFLKGHRIMVQVQSTWFPLYDRNPQKFVPNIFLAQESDFQTASQRVYRSPRYPSRVSVSVAVNKAH